jgi:hypothetical protein
MYAPLGVTRQYQDTTVANPLPKVYTGRMTTPPDRHPIDVTAPDEWPPEWDGFDFELGLVTARPPSDPRWEVAYELAPVSGAAVIRSIHVRPAGDGEAPPDGLLARTARDLIRPGAALAFHRFALASALTWDTRELPKLVPDLVLYEADDDGDDPSESRARRRAGRIVAMVEAKWPDMPHTAEDWRAYIDSTLSLVAEWQHVAVVPANRIERLARTAQLYVAAREDGHRAPVRRVAELQERIPASVRDDIHEARLEGLLTKTRGYGHAGGTLTPRARQVLREATR